MKTKLDNARLDNLNHRATDIMLMEDPLDFIAEDHMRVKTVAETMMRIASEPNSHELDLLEATTFLTNELPLLMRDEDDDLLVLLERRVGADDNFAKLKTELASIHQAIEAESKDVMARLNSARTDNAAPSVYDRSKIETLAKRLLQDMIVENAKLLPLARHRLTNDDITTLRSNMVQRRIRDMRGARDNAR